MRERFFIYVVTQALSNPSLNIVKASDLTQEILLEAWDLQLNLIDVKVAERIAFENLT